MLKFSIFSDNYLNHRLERNNEEKPEIQGSLAVSTGRKNEKSLLISRSNSRIWWESGWKQKK
ncbi:MAG: hypothetical protein AB1403_03260 [Candidatus Riflebacteria bacterium]